jgi:osmotically-inducible protein OsmY
MDKRGKSRLARLAATGLIVVAGCGEQDADKLSRVGRKSIEKVEVISGADPTKLNDGWRSLRANWDEVTLDTRLAVRFRWDKRLEGADIHIHSKDGIVELKGTVRDMAQRRRAVEIAESTVGAEKVTDEMSIAEE